ncbi:tartrate dehydrogenase/decarboxylase / D-malate dehydrogenase [Natronincola peptidivorans]|uniref:D-malate dehydrogenase (decarboxylating) n=1 Tax=Natronincola peptidivorans TaxID=426128 RepID=A0A1I0BQ42_9FIRM|nr:tartrate dehydrogenase [Natronincola peptidivorans]SET08741.1 tartrate dehydrogenase/decarboxylase / D-malate dehydrogenase [Natronincola peptidivorans]
MKRFKIAVIPGDGIGNEVTAEGIKVLDAFAAYKGNIGFDYEFFPWGCEYYLKTGNMMEEDGLKTLEKFDAILLGAVGDPSVPDHISLHGLLIKIRQGFNQSINLRPVKLLPGAPCPLKDKKPEDIDFVVIRENVEGEYSGVGGIRFPDRPEETAIQTSVFTRKNTEKIMDYAFKLAQKRNKFNKVTNVTKSNALNYSMVFWDKIFQEVAGNYEEITTETTHVDAVSMYFIQKPEAYDVLVASNLFGDIITDLGAALQGGLGFAASGNLNIEKEYPSMFEPVHGSAPDIKDKGIANPMAMIWTAKMMLDFLLEDSDTEAIIKAITEVLVEGKTLTPDLKGNAKTSEVGDAVCEKLKSILG